MNTTPVANRLHIGIFGRRNVGKSSFIWSPALEQLQLRNGVLFFVPKVQSSTVNLVDQYKKLQQAEEQTKDIIEPRLTLG